MTQHTPVLLRETLDLLKLREGSVVIDGTLGGGGHAEQLLEVIGPTGELLGIDRDPAAIARCQERFRQKTNVVLLQGNYREVYRLGSQHGFVPADAILLDLGFSSDQMGDPSKGLSFQQEGPLDMRFGEGDLTAAEIVNHWSEKDLADVLYRFGEERRSRQIAHQIVRSRPIASTTELAEVVRHASRGRQRIHPATRTFQALRIAVNEELDALTDFLADLERLLKPGGRVAIISFHSLEDRLVKDSFRAQAMEGKLRIVTKKPIRPTEGERATNPRSRSAKLRVAEAV